jgi:hypothetical protein
VPLPVVNNGSSSFPSLYPYVDFVDKAFVYNTASKQYAVIESATRTSTEPEIWHGVINPAVGRVWDGSLDIPKIRDFLTKTHDFYTKSGKFTPTIIPPRVFYYDGYYESQSVTLRSLFQYALGMENSENLAYNRFTKYLLGDINTALGQFDAANDAENNAELTSLGLPTGTDGFDADTLRKMPDIKTEIPIKKLLKNFKSIINDKTLGDALKYIHNAGRYNSGTTVRADLAPLSMTLMDEVGRSTLREANTAMMNSIDQAITSA